MAKVRCIDTTKLNGKATKLQIIMHPSLVLCGVTTSYLFSSDSEIETLTINVDGVAGACIYRYFDDSSMVYLSNLVVYPQFRNKGIGEKLQVEREQIGQDIGAEYACLWVKEETWMHEWYKRRGYSDFKDHEEKGFVWMTKPLTKLTVKDTICHSFIRDGFIEYLSDCTHSLAGKTVELKELQDGKEDY